MKARHFIHNASSYGPEALKAITQAFDEAWLAIAGNFSAEATAAARLRLAQTLLSVASEDSRDVKALKNSALATMALNTRYRPVRDIKVTIGGQEVMDPATSFLQQAPFDRSTAHMLCRVLDEGWASLRPHLGGRATDRAARLNIADAIFALAKTGERDPEVLRHYAVSRAVALLGQPWRRRQDA